MEPHIMGKIHDLSPAIQYLHDKKHDHLTVRQLAMLLALRDGASTVRGMAARLKVHRPAVTRSADKFVGHGWVERRDDPDDRRSVLMVLTTKGRHLMENFN
jgi:DNA-binding MarR family transcriptional regulator